MCAVLVQISLILPCYALNRFLTITFRAHAVYNNVFRVNYHLSSNLNP